MSAFSWNWKNIILSVITWASCVGYSWIAEASRQQSSVFFCPKSSWQLTGNAISPLVSASVMHWTTRWPVMSHSSSQLDQVWKSWYQHIASLSAWGHLCSLPCSKALFLHYMTRRYLWRMWSQQFSRKSSGKNIRFVFSHKWYGAQFASYFSH